MKKNLFIRIMTALGGVALWMLGLCALAETFFAVPLTAWAGKLLAAGSPLAVLAALLGASLLCTFGVCCLMMLSGKRMKRRGFVMQKGENGVIGVSIKSIEGLVGTCVKQHEMVESAEIAVVEKRDGVVILLDIREAAGVNIPLAVGAMQKQIREYVNTCTGLDVHEVRVMVENTEAPMAESPYAVQSPVLPVTAEIRQELPEAEAVPAEEIPGAEAAEEAVIAQEAAVEEIPQTGEIPADTETAPMVMEVAAPPIPAMPAIEMAQEEDDRPLHQRLFGAEEEPVFVPMPPVVYEAPAEDESAEEPAEEPAPEAETAEEIPEEPDEEGMDANAVLDVVNAMAEEEVLPEEEKVSEESENAEIPADGEDELPQE